MARLDSPKPSKTARIPIPRHAHIHHEQATYLRPSRRPAAPSGHPSTFRRLLLQSNSCIVCVGPRKHLSGPPSRHGKGKHSPRAQDGRWCHARSSTPSLHLGSRFRILESTSSNDYSRETARHLGLVGKIPCEAGRRGLTAQVFVPGNCRVSRRGWQYARVPFANDPFSVSIRAIIVYTLF